MPVSGAEPNARDAIAQDAQLGFGAALIEVDRFTIDGGGGRSSGGVFSVDGTIGQPDADPFGRASGGVYSVSGGFWNDAARGTQANSLFADGFEQP